MLWTSGRTGQVKTTDYNGKSISTLYEFKEDGNILFGLALDQDHLYISSWHPGSVDRVNLVDDYDYEGDAPPTRLLQDEAITSEVFSLVVVAASLQQQHQQQQQQEDQPAPGGMRCSQICRRCTIA